MDKNTVIIALITLVIGFGGGYLIAGREPAIGTHVMPNGMMMDDSGMSMGAAMHDMMTGLEGKKGDEFDKAFLSGMIVHHQGAVQMAEAALINAKHEEIKQMAHAIITAQTAEISQMKDRQKSWYSIGQ
jgi:uncharacterized protein (DUF305 family)